MIHVEYNERVLELWRELSLKYGDMVGMDRVPMLEPQFVADPELLFVGINPSFAREEDDEQLVALFSWPASGVLSQERIRELVAREADALTYRYYTPLQAFAKKVGARSVEFLDLFPIRHSRQRDILEQYCLGALHPVAERLFAHFRWSLRTIKPQVIVVANAGAARLLESHLPLTGPAADSHYQWEEMKGVPFFLGGMLGGAGPMDRFSRERLEIAVKRVLQDRTGR